MELHVIYVLGGAKHDRTAKSDFYNRLLFSHAYSVIFEPAQDLGGGLQGVRHNADTLPTTSPVNRKNSPHKV